MATSCQRHGMELVDLGKEKAKTILTAGDTSKYTISTVTKSYPKVPC